ncbi:MAG: TRM11 family SAM-dependent methyltransferase [Candidatus Zipacnadales bacterium]
MVHFCLLSAQEHEWDLAWAELQALAGVRTTKRLVKVPAPIAVDRAAYVMVCAEQLASGPTPEALADELAPQGLSFERFRVTTTTIPPRPKIPTHQALLQITRPIHGTVDLINPWTELLLVGSASGWYLGRVISRSDKSFRAHERKPYVFSSSLPARLARGVVNLVAAPGETLVDPCCGVGSVLLEAWAIGIRAVGGDINRKLVGMTRVNLRYFGYPPWVCLADASIPWACADAVVTDLPYGRQFKREDDLYNRLLCSFPNMARRLALVTAEDVRSLLEEAGYEVLQEIIVLKSRTFARHIYVAQVR